MKRHFKFELKIRHTEKVFKEGMGPGVFVSEIASWDQEERYMKGGIFVGSLLSFQDVFIEKNIEVIMTEVDENDEPLHPQPPKDRRFLHLKTEDSCCDEPDNDNALFGDHCLNCGGTVK